jgi:endonuclease/exonuclease/phosphatase family metal-dependent hydrolase
VAILLPNFSPPYGAGVTTFAEKSIEIVEVERVPYSRCNGWFGENGDCWARKGFLMTRMRFPGGVEIDFYDTHLDAGPTPDSVSVRSSQFVELAEGIERLSSGRAVIAAGDFNVAFIRPGDRDMMMGFRERVHLDDTGAAPELPFWRERGFVLYRSGEQTRLTVEASGEAMEFVSGSRALSDHAALWVRVRAEAAAP